MGMRSQAENGVAPATPQVPGQQPRPGTWSSVANSAPTVPLQTDTCSPSCPAACLVWGDGGQPVDRTRAQPGGGPFQGRPVLTTPLPVSCWLFLQKRTRCVRTPGKQGMKQKARPRPDRKGKEAAGAGAPLLQGMCARGQKGHTDMYPQSAHGHTHTHGPGYDPGASGCLLWGEVAPRPWDRCTFMSPHLG